MLPLKSLDLKSVEKSGSKPKPTRAVLAFRPFFKLRVWFLLLAAVVGEVEEVERGWRGWECWRLVAPALLWWLVRRAEVTVEEVEGEILEVLSGVTAL